MPPLTGPARPGPIRRRELTYALLDQYFQLALDIPIDSLCPTVTVR